MSWQAIWPYDGPAQFLPRPGAYCIFEKGRVVYVGESVNLRSRFRQHSFVLSRYSLAYWSTSFGFLIDPVVKVRYSRRFGEEAMRERRLIRRLRPKHNRRGVPVG